MARRHVAECAAVAAVASSMHLLSKRFHRIRHYGLFAWVDRAENIATVRALLNGALPAVDAQERPDIATTNSGVHEIGGSVTRAD